MKKEKNTIKILAIETSCDETAASLLVEQNGKPQVLSNVVSSQVDLHAKTGGVVPEVASRAHIESIIPVISEVFTGISSLNKNLTLKDITHIAVTAGPGLIGSLLVGYNTAKALAYSLNIPIVYTGHIDGHIHSAYLEKSDKKDTKIPFKFRTIEFPALSLTVSGGHTSLINIIREGDYQILGQTLDDAAGEAFDKVAKLLNLGYPGGPALSRLADEYRLKSVAPIVNLPLPLKNSQTFDFSYSGLKTAVLKEVKEADIRFKDRPVERDKFYGEIARAFEDVAVGHLIQKTKKAIQKYHPKTALLAGGVSANKLLRIEMQKLAQEFDIKLLMPEMELTGDNAAMIAAAAYFKIKNDDLSSWNIPAIDTNKKI